jgi:hypothetical protein
MIRIRLFLIFILLPSAAVFCQTESFHRAEDDREITYWLLDPATHQFRFSHDFNITRPGQKYAHSFVRKGSTVSDDITFIDLDTGKRLNTSRTSGKAVNALGYYPDAAEDDDVVVQGELLSPVLDGGSVRIRVMETYTDSKRYFLDKNGELVWDRTFGRSRNEMKLPPGWMLVSLNVPAIIFEDEQGLLTIRFTNARNDELAVQLRARKRDRASPQSHRGAETRKSFFLCANSAPQRLFGEVR